MSTEHLPAPAHGIHLEFRPSTYFAPWGPPLLATIKGAERRAAVSRLIAGDHGDDLPDFLTRSSLDEDDRRTFGSFHPACMGGEYLPDLRPGEVEIARITIASTTHDVTAVYARRCGDRIAYRVVDEYEGQTLSERTTRTSAKPLTLAELEAFFLRGWALFDVLTMNFDGCGRSVDDMIGFVLDVESQFYPELDALFRQRIEGWAEAEGGAIAENEDLDERQWERH